MNDVMVTLGTFIAGLVAWRQKAKDEQIKRLQDDLERLNRDLEHCYDKRKEMADSIYKGE